MARKQFSNRIACLRQTEDNFYLIVDRPYNSSLLDFKRLRNLSRHCVVRTLENNSYGGAQVFCYPREEFHQDETQADSSRDGQLTDSDRFVERTELALRKGEHAVILDRTIGQIEGGPPPLSGEVTIIYPNQQ